MGRLLCDTCYSWIDIDKSDFGFCEVECPTCGMTSYLPETLEQLAEQNEFVMEEKIGRASCESLRIMAVQETGEECCLRNGIPANDDDFIDIIIAGYQQRYPECRIFTEIETNGYNFLDFE